MRSMKTRLAVALMFLLVGCATQYGPKGPTGGYEDMQLSSNKWRVIYYGNQKLGALGTEKGLLRRAAELVKAAGFTSFVVSKDEKDYQEYNKTVVIGNNVTTAKSFKREAVVTGYDGSRAPASSYSVDFILKETAN